MTWRRCASQSAIACIFTSTDANSQKPPLLTRTSSYLDALMSHSSVQNGASGQGQLSQHEPERSTNPQPAKAYESSTDDDVVVTVQETQVDAHQASVAEVTIKTEPSVSRLPRSISQELLAEQEDDHHKSKVQQTQVDARPAPVVAEVKVEAKPASPAVAPVAAAPAEVAVVVVAAPTKEPVAAEPEKPAEPEAAEAPRKPVAPLPSDIAASDDHTIPLEVVADRFQRSNINAANPKTSTGLSSQDAANLLAVHGRNALTPPKELPKILLFLKQFLDPFLIMLLIAGAFEFGVYGFTPVASSLYAAIALMVVVFLTAFVTFIQELKTANVMAQFKNMLQAQTHVIRDGQESVIDAELLVVGDVVKVMGGDKVPADCRIIYCQGLKVENASITGESRPITLNNVPSAIGLPPTESLCLCYKGSLAVEGEAFGVVIRTGDRTFIGQIASLTAGAKELPTTLEVEVKHFIKFIAILSLTTGMIAFAIALGRNKGHQVIQIFIDAFVVVIVANVPQGLPATVTSLLGITASRMAKLNVLIKKLDCVETLGCTSVICTDKTGTLTKNEMTVTELWVDEKNRTDDYGSLFVVKRRRQRSASTGRHSESDETRSRTYSTSEDDDIGSMASGISRARRGEQIISKEVIQPDGSWLSTFELMHRIGSVCNKCIISKKELAADAKGKKFGGVDKIDWIGNASDIAVLKFCHNLRSSNTIRQNYPVDFEIPFNSSNKWMLTVCHEASGPVTDGKRSYHVMMKGAPEIILKKCSTFLKHGEERFVDDAFEDEFEEAYEKYGNKGCRVLAVAVRTIVAEKDAEFTAETDNYPTDDLCFIGMFAITDPPRDGVATAIEHCHTAGVRVFMVTGDHHLTAKAIAKQVGILEQDADDETDRYTVILGAQLESLTDDDWKVIAQRPGVVFARTTPQHKLKIVQNCQKQGHIVAVTGDGVNDAPALKNANIGVAMGLNGSDVAREAAKIVLLDDNFASIVNGVEQGRVIFENLKKSIAYTLTHLLPELVSVLIFLFFGLPQGLSTLQILSIDLGTELGPAISLAYEGPESDIMNRPPRSTKSDRLVSRPLLLYAYLWMGTFESVAGLFAYFWVFGNYGIEPSQLFNTATNNWAQYNNDPFCYGSHNNITLPCLKTDEQASIAAIAASSFYLTLVLAQGFHVVMCRTSRISILKHKHSNPLVIYGIIIQLVICIIFVYVPGVQPAFFSGNVGYPGWVCLAAVGVVIIVFNEWRKWYFIGHPDSFITRELRW